MSTPGEYHIPCPGPGFEALDSIIARARQILEGNVTPEEQELAEELSERAEWTWVTGICNKGEGHFDDEGACSSHYSADVYIIPRAHAPFDRHPDYEAIARQIGESGRG